MAIPNGRLIRCLVVLTLLSSVLMVVLTFTDSFLGPTYSDQRFTRIDVNVVLTLTAAIASLIFVRTGRAWVWCAVSGFLLFGFWVYLRVVNSVV